jgi:hypothetical protein
MAKVPGRQSSPVPGPKYSLCCRVTPQLRDAVHVVAADRNITVNYLVELLLEEAVERHQAEKTPAVDERIAC